MGSRWSLEEITTLGELLGIETTLPFPGITTLGFRSSLLLSEPEVCPGAISGALLGGLRSPLSPSE